MICFSFHKDWLQQRSDENEEVQSTPEPFDEVDPVEEIHGGLIDDGENDAEGVKGDGLSLALEVDNPNNEEMDDPLQTSKVSKEMSEVSFLNENSCGKRMMGVLIGRTPWVWFIHFICRIYL